MANKRSALDSARSMSILAIGLIGVAQRRRQTPSGR